MDEAQNTSKSAPPEDGHQPDNQAETVTLKLSKRQAQLAYWGLDVYISVVVLRNIWLSQKDDGLLKSLRGAIRVIGNHEPLWSKRQKQ